MRLSSDKNSKYYDEGRVKCVYLDSMKVEDAVEADEEEGWVIHLKMNENGAPYLVYEDGTEVKKDGRTRAKEMAEGIIDDREEFVAKEKLYGEIVIAFRPEVEIITDEIDVLVMDISANLSFLEREVKKLKKLNERED